MPRAIPLGNGKMLVNFDSEYVLRDVFFPHVGQENHTSGQPCHTGAWSNGRFAWLQDPAWARTVGYLEDTLVTHVRLYHPQWRLELVFNDAVDLDRAILLRQVRAANLSDAPQEVRLFFHYDFDIYGVGVGDTILYDPRLKALIAYKGKRYFLANVQNSNGTGVLNWAIGVTGFQGREGTWRDAEDGRLQGNPIAQGSVDGTVALDLGTVAPGGSATGFHWLAAGQSRADVERLDQLVLERSPESFVDRTRDWWRAWRHKEETDFADLTPELTRLYNRSLLTIRTHVDDGGGVIASTDWDIINYSRDSYCYCWPRDGAIAAIALLEAGYGELSRRFFDFCMRVLNPFDGYFLHKFTPSGDLASSWHPQVDEEGRPRLAIQEDETGLVLYALWEHYQRYRDIEFIKPLYRPLVRGAADFMVGYRDKQTGLPLPSYDLWEERWGVHAFTLASVWAGLTAAANFAYTFSQQSIGEGYAQAADEVRQATLTHLWDAEKGHFSRSLLSSEEHSYRRDSTLDASVLALSLLGMLDPRDVMVRKTAEAVHQRLWCKTSVGGLARFENDGYQRVSDDTANIPGNPWFVSTLWLAQYYISLSETAADLEKAKTLMRWVEQHALPSGLLAEQLDPHSGAPLSVCPLTWSHAEFVRTVHRYVEAYNRLA